MVTRVSHTLFNSSTLSPVHCDQSHSDVCLCDLLTSNISVKKAYGKHGEIRQPTLRTAMLDYLMCLLARCLPGLLLHCVCWLALAVVPREAERGGSGSGGVKKRNRENTRVKKKSHVEMNKKTKWKHELSRLDWNGCSSCSQVSREFERSYAVKMIRQKKLMPLLSALVSSDIQNEGRLQFSFSCGSLVVDRSA